MNVVSYCLYGAPDDHRPRCDQTDNRRLYWSNAILNIHLAKMLYPGWDVHLYVDEDFWKRGAAAPIILLEEAGLVSIFRGPPVAGHAKMLWRLLPLFHGDANAVVLRDLDSIITPTESRLVRLWLKTGEWQTTRPMPIHCIRAHPYHSAAIMGGLCGFIADAFRKKTMLTSFDDMRTAIKSDTHQTDQVFLARRVLPMYQPNSILDHRIRNARRANPPELPPPTEAEEKLAWLDSAFSCPGHVHVPTVDQTVRIIEDTR